MAAETTLRETSGGERILRWPEVQRRVGICRSYAHQLAAAGEFPKPIKLGPRASGWLESSISRWIEGRVAASEGEQK